MHDTWGYHPEQDPQVFVLRNGQKLPKGWVDSPAKLPKGKSIEIEEVETLGITSQEPRLKTEQDPVEAPEQPKGKWWRFWE